MSNIQIAALIIMLVWCALSVRAYKDNWLIDAIGEGLIQTLGYMVLVGAVVAIAGALFYG